MHVVRRVAARSLILVTFVSTLLVVGCGGDAAVAKEDVQVLTPTLVAQSASTVEFSRVAGMGVDSRGQIYAGDALGEIVVLDQNGQILRRLGRMGGGPGEFQSVGGVHLVGGDSLFVFDPVAIRATVYPPGSNRVAYTTRFPEPNLSFPMEIEPLSTGDLIGHFRGIHGDVPGTNQARNDVIHLLRRDGSIHRGSVLEVRQPEIVGVGTGSSQGFFFPAFARETLVRWDSHGRLYTLWTDSARVRVYEPTGHPVGEFTANLPENRLPLSDPTIDSVARRSASGGLTHKMLSDALRSRWKTWPLVDDMLVDDQSRIWIKPVTHDSVGDWYGFTPRGQRVASFQLPSAVTPRLIRGDRLYGVSRDSLDVESVVVYRLTPSSTPTRERP